MVKTTALYLRVSTQEKQKNGLQGQLLALEAFCKAHSIGKYQVYSDEGYSGAICSRPDLDRLIVDCKVGRIDQVIVFSFSRFGRSLKHLIDSLEFFQSLGVGFVSISEKLDTNTSMGKVMFAIISALGQWEREQVSIRVKAGMANAKSKGRRIGALKKYTNPEPFMQLRAKGLSIRKVAKVMKCSPATVSKNLTGVQLTEAT